MGKALFFNIPATGHINPSLNLVRELLGRGEDVIYVDTEDTRALIEASGAAFVPYPRVSEIEGNFERIKHGHMSDHALALHEIMLACLPFELLAAACGRSGVIDFTARRRAAPTPVAAA